MSRRRVTIRVDRLSVPPHLAKDGGAIQSALRAEVTRALTGSTIHQVGSKSLQYIDGGTVTRATGSSVGARVGDVLAKGALT